LENKAPDLVFIRTLFSFLGHRKIDNRFETMRGGLQRSEKMALKTMSVAKLQDLKAKVGAAISTKLGEPIIQ
jgi:hypothetical protein